MSRPTGEARRLLRLLLVGALLVAGTAPTVVAAEPTDSGLVVELHDDGTATVTLRTTYDLAREEEARAFAELREDEGARERLVARYAERMTRVAAAAEAETDRTMRISEERVALSTNDGVGVVALSVRWEGLAATDDGRLTVAHPFASGFDVDRPLTLVGPTGYDAVETAPAPDSRTENRLAWESGAELDGFEVAFAPSGVETDSSADGPDTGTNVPGFGAVVAVVALFVAAMSARLRE
ncbi:PGF-CTERM sorting domain-containing protein [Halogeometricum sp. S1BR25-6]|uniref:PGF-CTERM sorting domain-containing protein n=1 Tax=Halogeometricum salsisoli TaxID=2950536 RepID=A0ABU2GBA1_9EURY|nr:PGF-CTERM sorting domain-containing protein [Halogeometricum sp. S1BR25-6]MDS0297413.1 PGF-CTERM sorting domain-containing protein [Halogeometricum sp. S1BR25-6]